VNLTSSGTHSKGILANNRRLFQRVLAMKMSTKKAKFFFKKWLQWETESGDANGVEDVKRRAREYVEGLTAV
jgi:rRNA biogenesis protein RRP5